MSNPIKHFVTITKHRMIVCGLCFKAGIPIRGMLHDLSKYSYTEFHMGAKFYQGTRSPTAREREVNGYSVAWMHHKGRNKHHFEYWTDFVRASRTYEPVFMPTPFFTEMVCDRIAASKVYYRENYTEKKVYEYFQNEKNAAKMHPETSKMLEKYLSMLVSDGEKATMRALKELNRNERKKKK